MSLEQAEHMFGDGTLEKIKACPTYSTFNSDRDAAKTISVYQYWEKGFPYNGYQGRFCWCLDDGTPLSEMVSNPHGPQQKVQGKDVRKAALPYHPITEVDVINSYWGIPLVSFSISLQDEIALIDTVTLDAMRAMGTARMLLPEGTKIVGGLTNSPWDIVKYSGNIPPSANLVTQPVSPVMLAMREKLAEGIDETHGINESMQGKQNRETSGFAMQYAVSQGNTIRQRFFTKYVGMIEGLYKSYLQILQEHWTTGRTIKVIGKEKAFEVIDIKGADLMSGFDLVPEYGTSLPLDPMARQALMVQYLPLFKEAGVDSRKVLSMLKLADLGDVYDSLELASDRQREVFELMTKNKVYIKPDELQDHKGMLAWASGYIMTSEFRDLGSVEKQLIREHMKEREKLVVQDSTNPAGAPAAPAAPGAPEGPGEAAPGKPPANLAEILGG